MERKEQLFGHLRWMLLCHDDRIPKRMVHGGNSKVRGNWFQGVIVDLSNGLRESLIDGPQAREARVFIDEYLKHDFSKRTRRRDVVRANYVISRVLGDKIVVGKRSLKDLESFYGVVRTERGWNNLNDDS